jgi:hypothetical protein
MNLGNILKKLAPIAINAIAPGMGKGLGSPAVMSLLSGALGGEKPQNMLKGALLDKLGLGSLKQKFKPESLTGFEEFTTLVADPRAQTQTQAQAQAQQEAPKVQSKPAFEPKTYAGELAQTLGFEDSTIGKLLNTNIGEGLAVGLLAQLLASGDEEEKSPYGFEQRPFGGGGPGGQVGGLPIAYKALGGNISDSNNFSTNLTSKAGSQDRFFGRDDTQNFPRRDGGIDPSEGSGTKDDVPAMLTAGEFVLTKDAVKGLGNGNQRVGIQRAYDMMDNLERMA